MTMCGIYAELGLIEIPISKAATNYVLANVMLGSTYNDTNLIMAAFYNYVYQYLIAIRMYIQPTFIHQNYNQG